MTPSSSLPPKDKLKPMKEAHGKQSIKRIQIMSTKTCPKFINKSEFAHLCSRSPLHSREARRREHRTPVGDSGNQEDLAKKSACGSHPPLTALPQPPPREVKRNSQRKCRSLDSIERRADRACEKQKVKRTEARWSRKKCTLPAEVCPAYNPAQDNPSHANYFSGTTISGTRTLNNTRTL